MSYYRPKSKSRQNFDNGDASIMISFSSASQNTPINNLTHEHGHASRRFSMQSTKSNAEDGRPPIMKMVSMPARRRKTADSTVNVNYRAKPQQLRQSFRPRRKSHDIFGMLGDQMDTFSFRGTLQFLIFLFNTAMPPLKNCRQILT